MLDRVEKLEVWHCALPMPRPLHLGAITYTSRDYVIVRLTTHDGVTGSAIGYTRDTPLFEALTLLGPHIASFEGTPAEAADMLKRRFAPGWASLVRAASLIEIALSDIEARRQSVPLSNLFGSAARDVPLMVVAGYFLDQRGQGEIVDEVRSFVDDRYETIKLIVPGHDLDSDLALVRRVQDVLPSSVQLAIDFHGAFADVEEAIAYCRNFDDLGLRFIEDPFPSYEVPSVRDVADSLSTPIASGEDVSTPSVLQDLIEGGVGYLRADATASGGYTAALKGIARATSYQAKVAPHVWPHIHMPLAASMTAVAAIEIIPHDTGADPIDLVLREPFPISDGRWITPPGDGLYLPLDWERVAAHADATWTHRA
ncbi:mandelate racemase/muconate lactonizing enzyme family protein [Curtobacterium sp. 9128]|uniref:mandelate racemase/muconate lactonizing enzyme family protein n=1 Tax=Curtobacterium sp. 9128 TaxID=1793722 RepID=UPI0011A54A73|nr:enolase C-terminal domain-like protein [Curtobacterium sp. 9128]